MADSPRASCGVPSVPLMRFRSALSAATDLKTACTECAAVIGVDGEPPDLLLAFASPQLADLEDLPSELARTLRPRQLAGCSGGGVLAEGREIESGAGLALLAAWWPRVDGVAAVRTQSRLLSREELPGPDAPPSAWHELFEVERESIRGFAIFPDPWSFPVTPLLDGLDYAFHGVPKFGGLVSGSGGTTDQHLFLDDRHHGRGAVVVAFAGDLRIDTVVTQGCRPIGRPGTVTEGTGQDLMRVDDRTALGFLQEQIDALDETETEMARRSTMFIGLAMDPFTFDAPDDGEYLMRNIVGLDRQRGSLTIAGRPSAGRKIRFHLRDATASDDDLRRVLAGALKGPPPTGALLFACLGRGRDLYGDADHDSRAFRDAFGPVPIGGFFCNGEIGPVGVQTYLHGYTAVFALFRPGTDA